MDFSIKQIMPHVYHLDFGTQYDVAMHFLRFQEYYESPKFHKKFFSIAEYMRWYSLTYGKGAFTYPDDWGGFNVPSWVLREVRCGPVPDSNECDFLMRVLIDRVLREEGEHPFYFIGTYGGGDKKDVLDHEIAHALFTVNEEYRSKVNRLLNKWEGTKPERQNSLTKAYNTLKEMGYHTSTIYDEIHAYSATGLCKDLKEVIPKGRMKPFRELFKEYQEKCAQSK